MKYISTRGNAPSLQFNEALLAGLARDGGLYLPNFWPQFSKGDLSKMHKLSYVELAFLVIKPFVGEDLSPKSLKSIIHEAYSVFKDGNIAPLKHLGANEYLLELFHGPTLAFKDIAMQFLGPLFDHILNIRGERTTLVGATSGDTGSAAIAAFRDRKMIDIFILYPDKRISEVQRRQMTTVNASNVHCIALDGTFDDCQDMVKAMFNNNSFRAHNNLSAINSINWARIMSQIVYYFWAALRVGVPKTAVSFSVPTGNFGNVFAGYVAKKMGLPIKQLIVGSNRNDILTRFFEAGTMELDKVYPTISPSMDIQVSSNFERLLFELYEGNGALVADSIEEFRNNGKFVMDSIYFEKTKCLFSGACFDDNETLKMMKTIFEESGELIDPHTAVGVAAARTKSIDSSIPMICLATAHPAKFPNSSISAPKKNQNIPDQLTGIFEHDEFLNSLPNHLPTVQKFISSNCLKALTK